MRLPDFIIAGAPRAGTTWLCRLLERHPEIGLAQPVAPEPKFFLLDSLYEQGLSFYADRWFGGLPQRIVGEKSTNYLENSMVAGRIARGVPRVKLIFVLRDPVERAFSNYRWSRMNGLETASFADAIATETTRPTPPAWRHARPFDYISRGEYARLLRPWFDLFDATCILLLRFDDIVKTPRHVARQAHEFLGAAARPDDATDLPAINGADQGGLGIAEGETLARHFQAHDIALANMTGLDISGWRSQRAMQPA